VNKYKEITNDIGIKNNPYYGGKPCRRDWDPNDDNQRSAVNSQSTLLVPLVT